MTVLCACNSSFGQHSLDFSKHQFKLDKWPEMVKYIDLIRRNPICTGRIFIGRDVAAWLLSMYLKLCNYGDGEGTRERRCFSFGDGCDAVSSIDAEVPWVLDYNFGQPLGCIREIEHPRYLEANALEFFPRYTK